MSNHNLARLPLADPTEARWASVLDHCDPLLHSVALVGISAVQHGVAQVPNYRASELLAGGQLLDSVGGFNKDLATEMGFYSLSTA